MRPSLEPDKGGFQVESGAEEDLEHSELEDVEGNDEAEEDVDDGEGGLDDLSDSVDGFTPRKKGTCPKAGILGGPCAHCNATKSPQWRRPLTKKVILCNACGIYFSRHHALPKRKKIPVAQQQQLLQQQQQQHQHQQQQQHQQQHAHQQQHPSLPESPTRTDSRPDTPLDTSTHSNPDHHAPLQPLPRQRQSSQTTLLVAPVPAFNRPGGGNGSVSMLCEEELEAMAAVAVSVGDEQQGSIGLFHRAASVVPAQQAPAPAAPKQQHQFQPQQTIQLHILQQRHQQQQQQQQQHQQQHLQQQHLQQQQQQQQQQMSQSHLQSWQMVHQQQHQQQQQPQQMTHLQMAQLKHQQQARQIQQQRTQQQLQQQLQQQQQQRQQAYQRPYQHSQQHQQQQQQQAQADNQQSAEEEQPRFHSLPSGPHPTTSQPYNLPELQSALHKRRWDAGDGSSEEAHWDTHPPASGSMQHSVLHSSSVKRPLVAAQLPPRLPALSHYSFSGHTMSDQLQLQGLGPVSGLLMNHMTAPPAAANFFHPQSVHQPALFEFVLHAFEEIGGGSSVIMSLVPIFGVEIIMAVVKVVHPSSKPPTALLEVVRLAFEEGIAIDNLAEHRRGNLLLSRNACTEETSEASSPTSERGRREHDHAWDHADMPSAREQRSGHKQQHHSPASLGPATGLVTKLVPGGPCSHCQCTLTPQWRRPKGRDMVLCNACGIYFSRYNKFPPRKPLAESQSPFSEPSHAELLVRADATLAAPSTLSPPTVTTNRHAHAPASTHSTAPTQLHEDEGPSPSPLGHAIAAPSNGDGADMNMDLTDTDHHLQSTRSDTGMQQLSPRPAGARPAGVSRRHPHAPPLRTASLPLLGGGPASPQLPRTSSRRRHPSSRFAEYDDPPNMQAADNDPGGGGRSAALSRPAFSHSGTATATAGRGGRVSSAATSKLRRQRDSDDTSGDSDVSTGHERRAHRSSASHMSTLGPHHSSPPHTASHSHTIDHDMASGVAQTGNGAPAPLSEPAPLLLLRQHLEHRHTPQASPRAPQRVVTTTLSARLLTQPAPKTYPQSIPYTAAPAPPTQTTTHLAHGSSAGSSLEDILYIPLHPLHPSPRAPPLAAAASSPPSLPLPPDHTPSHFPPPVPTQHPGPVQHPGLSGSQRPGAASPQSQPSHSHQDRSSVPQPPMPCSSTPSGESQSSAVTPPAPAARPLPQQRPLGGHQGRCELPRVRSRQHSLRHVGRRPGGRGRLWRRVLLAAGPFTGPLPPLSPAFAS
ncbi:MAG: hypothetical protein WDW38_001632 [Sanguina aurantia]